MTSQHDRTLLQGLAVGSSARSEGEAGRVHGQLTLLHSLSGHLPRFPSVSLGERVCHSVCTQAAIWSCLLHGFLVCSSPSWSWHGQPLFSVDHQLPSLPLEAADCPMCPARLEAAHPRHCPFSTSSRARGLEADRRPWRRPPRQLLEPCFHPQQMPLTGPLGLGQARSGTQDSP